MKMKELENNKMHILAIFKAPAPYIDPLFQLWSKYPLIDLTVAYCVKTTDGESYYDTSIGKQIRWGKRLLEGYNYFFLTDEIEPVGKSDLKIKNPQIKRYIRNNKIDVILMACSYWSPTTWMTIKAAKRKNIPIVTRMIVEAERKRNFALSIVKKVLVGRYCKHMSAGVYECRQQKDYLEKYGMHVENLFSAPCAVDNDYYLALADKYDKEILRREYGIQKDDVVFVSTGMLVPRKRQKDVLYALIELKKECIEPYYYIVGDGENRGELEKIIKENNLRNVYIMGQLPQGEMSKYLKIADVYILSSEYDASPKALNEAMNFSLPIIITKGVGTAEQLLKEGKNGYIYSPGDTKRLTEIIRTIIKRNDREVMGKMSREIVGKCDYKGIINGWMSALQYALDHKKRQ